MTDAERKWLEVFPNLAPEKVMEQFFPLLGAAWEAKKKVFTAASWEDAITRTLFQWMRKTMRGSSTIHWGLHCQPEIIEEGVNGIGRVIGRCDLIITVSNVEYIYECKRLWPEGKKGAFTKSAQLYATQGLSRFLQASKKQIASKPQYPSWLGVAGMLGYVMNGIISDAHNEVKGAINLHASPKSVSDPHKPACPAAGARRFLTVHSDCIGNTVQIHHVLLPV